MRTSPRQSQIKLIVAATVLAVAGFALLLALLIGATSSSNGGEIDSASYSDELDAALTGADAAFGERLIAETDCATCHLTGEGRTAPLFDRLASVAGQRRSPLSAEQYLYEAIVYPGAHLVDGYANAMPNDYGQRFSIADIGHMIAYLLTLTGEGVEA
ncbi:MAG: cytochrome c [Chloroflexi bacterium]|nr:cytochrome c [Chloroflexota bacterium]